jgi:HEAT repeat protein
VQEDQYRKHTFFRGRERLLLVHSVLFSGSKNIGKPGKIPRAIIQLLGEQLEDEDPAVREAALNSIGSIGIPDIEPLLFRVEQ